MVRIFWCMLSERELTGIITRCIKLREDTVSLLRRWKCSVTTNHGSLKIFEVCWNEEMVAFWKSWMEFSEREGLWIQGFHSKNTFWEQEWAKTLNRQCKACMGGTPVHHEQGKGTKQSMNMTCSREFVHNINNLLWRVWCPKSTAKPVLWSCSAIWERGSYMPLQNQTEQSPRA